jgi:hypothetical protein
MTQHGFHVIYDSATDLLYVTPLHSDSRPAGRGDPDLLWCWANGEDLVGVKVADFDAQWPNRFDAVDTPVARRSGPSATCAGLKPPA